MADDSNENEPLLEASPRAPSRRALKISGGATVLALCLLGVVAARTRTPTRTNLAPIDETTWIKALNDQMRQSPTFNDDKDANVYSGGDNYGVIVRALDDGMTTGWDGAAPDASGRCKNANGDDILCLAVGTFWSNDIMAVSQFYSHDPWCPQTDADWHPCGNAPGTDGGASWRLPNLGIVVGSWMDALLEASNMGSKDDFNNIQNWGDPVNSWGWGSFYAHDSNAQDHRCIFINDPSGCFYDCPGGYLTASCPGENPEPWVWYDDASKMGAGAYPAGVYGGEAGGAGCHYDNNWISQVGMVSGQIEDDIESLTLDENCQCNYVYNDPSGWAHWVDVMYEYLKQSDYEGKGQAGMSWVQDETACWMNNFHDLIRLQNELYWKRGLYLDNNVPFSSLDFVNDGEAARKYWGWNEIAFTAGDVYTDTDGINNPQYWDAVFIWLPAFTCGVDVADNVYIWDEMKCVDQEGIDYLDKKIKNYVDNGALIPGADNSAFRPGSSVAIVRQIPEYDWDLSAWDETTGWTRQFYCESWDLNNFKIVYDPSTDNCYVDYKF